MIRVFFNEDGYFITGEGVEISRRFSPALTSNGDRIFQTLHHTYKIAYEALRELRDLAIKDDVIVYNDSRIIDEINGFVKPLDYNCDEWLKIIRRDILPRIKAVVFFRKKSGNDILASISAGHSEMLFLLGSKELEDIMQKELASRKQASQARAKGILNKLRSKWFGDKHDR